MTKYKGNLELNWINKDKSLYYEYDKDGNPGKPIWVEKDDITVSEPRILKLIKEYGDVSGLKDPLDNALIRGDNLLALRTLVEMFKEREEKDKVKCIYIDPPYNTGNDGFIYDDNLKHSEWLTMMRDRLYLLKNLLRKDGVIFISIDDREVHRLRLLMDEVFGAENFISQLIWRKKKGGGNNSIKIAVEHEYILLYSRIPNLERWSQEYTEDYKKRYNEKDSKGRFYWDTFARNTGSGKQYPIKAPDGTDIEYKDGKKIRWLWTHDTFKEKLKEGEIRVVKNKDAWSVQFKQRMGDGKKPRSILYDIATTANGTEDLGRYFSEKVFDNPKPINLINYLISISTNENNIILDSFAGSGTTAESVFDFNYNQISNRRFILIELQPKIANEVTFKRLQKVVDKFTQEKQKKLINSNISFGFRYYKLGESLLSDSKMNWNLTYEELANALFMNFDYLFEEKINGNTFFGKSGKNVAICIVAKEMKIIKKEELRKILDKVKNNKTTKITIFTNHGIAVKNEDLPDNITIKKIPESILGKYKL